MIAYPPPYLVEYRAAKAAMSSAGSKPGNFVIKLNNGEIFFFEGEKRDFAACPLCSPLLAQVPAAFVKGAVADLPFRGDLTEKLISNGTLPKSKLILGELSIKFAAIAARNSYCCVVEPGNPTWDMMAVCSAGALPALTISEFIHSL